MNILEGLEFPDEAILMVFILLSFLSTLICHNYK